MNGVHVIDHICRDRKDNSITNLRNCNATDNARNHKINKNNTSGTCGVRYISNRNKWMARINNNQNITVSRTFNTEAEAIRLGKRVRCL